ncbi:dipeptidase [Rhodococcus globerulus]|uniref:Dipeptidase n=1 Tax=Rhodococcus globerulus TaxID=33008 RepID=A0ABU4C385_RHOGO|nr:dipeptidase [Rhodococcus globerulus]MDV6270958.1 dipeptidase [Rhodococcus globerulus]
MDLTERINGLMPQVREELTELVAMQSVADPRRYPPEECHRAAQWVRDKFAQHGFTDARLEETVDGSYAVIGTRRCPDPHARTVLLYAHYDVQPPLDDSAWETPPFQLTERNGRWYGRGTADCKGNILVHLTALRALGAEIPVHLKLVVEGSEEQGTGGLEAFVPDHAGLLRADAILVCDTGNADVGRPAATVSLRGMINVVVTVEALTSDLHSGMFGGAAPDALAALVAMLATLRDAKGNTTVEGLDNTQTWAGERYPPEQFRADAGMLDTESLLGDGTISDMLWARPALTILGIDCPPVVGSASAIAPRARARLNLRIPPGLEPAPAQQALIDHLHSAAPWGVAVDIEVEASGAPYRARTEGPAYQALGAAMQEAYGQPMVMLGQGGSIPLCNVLADTYPDAEIILMGVEEPRALIHAPNESVDPSEIAAMSLVEARFLQNYANTHP